MKKGFIRISKQLYDESYDLISPLFLLFKPMHIEFRHWENDIWYFWGTSEKFDELKEGDAVPGYEVLITPHSHEITFNRLR